MGVKTQDEGRKKINKNDSQGACIKNPWTKTTRGKGRIESGRWGLGKAGEGNGGQVGTMVIE